MPVKTITDIGLCEWQAEFVTQKFNEGLRSTQLQDQPAPWVLQGLTWLETHSKLTPEKIAEINRSGGTDHPDPFVYHTRTP